VSGSSGGPLDGVRVVELAGVGPGPHTAMQLADMGADVVRIERPADPFSWAGAAVVSGRQRVRADLRDPHGAEDVRRLIAKADVLLEGFRPGVMERLGLGPTECLETNPRLVYARITGWGQEGAIARQAGHDINYLALTGVLHAIGSRDEPPVPPLNLVADFGGGSMFAVVGILAALFERQSSGLGQVVDVAMADGVGMLAHLVWALRGNGRWQDERESNLLDGGAPFYGTYECSDGRYVAVGAVEEVFFDRLVDGLGLRREVLPDQRDVAHWPEVKRQFAAVFKTRGRDEWVEVFDALDACVSPVLTFEEAIEHPYALERGSYVDVAEVIQPAPAPRFSRSELQRRESEEMSSFVDLLSRWSDAEGAQLRARSSRVAGREEQ
jgi:alpha-methylacyl-CoA racemase